MSVSKRFLDLAIYVAIAVGWLGVLILYWLFVPASSRVAPRWMGLFFFTALTFGYPIRWYYRRRKRRTWQFWKILVMLLLAHLACFIIVLSLVESWPLILFAIIMPIEWHFILPILEKAGIRSSNRGTKASRRWYEQDNFPEGPP